MNSRDQTYTYPCTYPRMKTVLSADEQIRMIRSVQKSQPEPFENILSGKLVGAMAALCGVFILSLPIPILVNGFATCYKNRLWTMQVANMRRDRLVRHDSLKKARRKATSVPGPVRIPTNWLRRTMSDCHCCWGKCPVQKDGHRGQDENVTLTLLSNENKN